MYNKIKKIKLVKLKKNKNMKKLLVALLLSTTSTLFSQSFNGVDVGMSLKKTDSTLKTKGYSLDYGSDKIQTDNIKTYKGKLNGDDINIIIVLTKTTNLVWKLVVEVKKSYDWYSSKNNYMTYKEILTEKYGQPTDDYHFFSSPYYEGDGYEMSAIYRDKCNYFCGWDKGDYNISIRIHSNKIGSSLIRVIYENYKIKNEDNEKLKKQNINQF